MIKFLITIIALTLSYLGITAMSKYDTVISILIFDYKINISMFLLLVIIVMIVSFSSLGIRMIGMILKMPYLIAERLAGYKKRSRTRAIMESYGQVIIGNYEAAQRMIARLDIKNIDEEYKEHINLLATICNQDFDKNMPMLQNLLSNKEYHDFAAKLLAKKLFDQGYYAQSLQYAEQVRVTTKNDAEIMRLMIKLYANLDMWEKFALITERYIGMYPKQDQIIAQDISNYYMKAAKFMLAEGGEAQAYCYLEKALEYSPINGEAIEMLCKINLTQGRGNINLDILEKAFEKAPSFMVFELYCQSSTINARDIYQRLGSLVDIISYRDIFFAMAAYLDLPEEIRALRIDSTEMLLSI